MRRESMMKKKLSLRKKKKKESLLQTNIKNTLMNSDERPKLMSDVTSRNYHGKQSKSGSIEEFCSRISGVKA